MVHQRTCHSLPCSVRPYWALLVPTFSPSDLGNIPTSWWTLRWLPDTVAQAGNRLTASLVQKGMSTRTQCWRERRVNTPPPLHLMQYPREPAMPNVPRCPLWDIVSFHKSSRHMEEDESKICSCYQEGVLRVSYVVHGVRKWTVPCNTDNKPTFAFETLYRILLIVIQVKILPSMHRLPKLIQGYIKDSDVIVVILRRHITMSL